MDLRRIRTQADVLARYGEMIVTARRLMATPMRDARRLGVTDEELAEASGWDVERVRRFVEARADHDPGRVAE
jgi:hypothetical protein